jgi:two-component system response regulator
VPETPWVLVAEDDDNDFGLVVRSVGKLFLDMQLQRGRNGQEAIDLLRSTTTMPFLVLLDVKMPKVSGLEVLQYIRENSATQFLPAVMFTSSAEAADMLNAYKLGCSAYLRKPISYSEFVEIIRSTFSFWSDVLIPAPT